MNEDKVMYQGQEVIVCDLCQEPVSFFCRSCGVNLCDPCVPVHLRVKCKLGHDVVDFASKDTEKSSFCDLHPGSKYSAYCKTCDVPICILCASIKHKSHKISELSDELKFLNHFALKKARIQSLNDQLGKILNHINKQLSVLSSFYQNMKDKVTAQGEVWHILVEKMVKERHQELDVVKFKNKTLLEKQKKNIEEVIGRMNEKIKRATKLQKAKNITEMEKFRHVDEEQEIAQYTLPNFCACKVDEKHLQTYFGYIEKIRENKVSLREWKVKSDVNSTRKIIKVPTVSCAIDTNFPVSRSDKSRLSDIIVNGDNKLCVLGANEELKLFDFDGNLHRNINIKCEGVHICMHKRNIHLTDTLNNTVKRITEDDTVVTTFTTGDWKPLGITGSASGELLVCLHKDDQSKVVRYSSTGTVLQEIEYDSQCQPLYKMALDITENANGDIVVSDNKKRAVIAVNKVGIFRYVYSGRKNEFDVCSLATNSVGHVIITDVEGDKIHMLNKDGRFLGYVIPKDGITRPRALCMIGDNELCVGECKSGLVKRIKFLQ